MTTVTGSTTVATDPRLSEEAVREIDPRGGEILFELDLDSPETREIARTLGERLRELPPFVLTPESILAMLRLRLRDLDDQVGMCMDAVEDATAEARAIGERVGGLRAVQEHWETKMDGNGALNGPSQFTGNIRPDLTEGELEDLAEEVGLDVDSLERPLTVEGLRAAASGALDRPLDAEGRPTIPSQYMELTAEYVDFITLPDGRRIDEILAASGFEVGEGLTMDVGGNMRERLTSAIQQASDDLRLVNSGNEMLMVQLQSTMQQRTSVIQMASNMLKSTDESMDAIVGNMR